MNFSAALAPLPARFLDSWRRGASFLQQLALAGITVLALPLFAHAAPPAPMMDWTGFYVGGNVGYGAADDSATFTVFNSGFGANTQDESYKLMPDSVVGGAQAGFNWQLSNNWVAGIEADFQATGQKDTACMFSCVPRFYANITQELDWFGTVRGRIGKTTGPLLLYLTGGLAYGRVETSADKYAAGISTGGSTAATKTGWAIGGGAEAALTGNWTAKVEYLYMDLGSQSLTFIDANGFPDTVSTRIQNHVARFGLNYRFGGHPAAPAYAAYGAMPLPVWAGFYGGLSAGYGLARNPTEHRETYTLTGMLLNDESSSIGPDGFVGGGALGYNRQWAHWVAGIETDIQAAGQHDSICILTCIPNGNAVALPVALDINQKISWFGTVRGRLGFAGPAFVNGALFYVTGGFAYGAVKTAITETAVGGPSRVGTFETRDVQTGWTAGGGIEAPVADGWTVKAEYLYLDLGSQTVTYAFPTAAYVNTVTTDIHDHIFRVGINYRFGSPMPVRN